VIDTKLLHTGFDANGDNVINKATLKKSLKSCRPVLKT